MYLTSNRRAVIALFVLLAIGVLPSYSEKSCIVEWSISNSYTIASQQSSYVTLNLYASTNGTNDIIAPYNITVYNPSYTDAFSWNFDVFSIVDGTIYGETQPNNGFWQTLLAGGKNVYNFGGNIETTNLNAPPLIITIDGLICFLRERQEGAESGSQGGSSSGTGSGSGSQSSSAAGASSGTGGSSGGTAVGSSTGGAGSGAGTTSGGTGGSTASGSGGATSASTSPPPGFIPGVITPPSPRNPGAVPSPPPPPAPAAPSRFPATNSTGQGKNGTSDGLAPGPGPAEAPYSRFTVLPVLP